MMPRQGRIGALSAATLVVGAFLYLLAIDSPRSLNGLGHNSQPAALSPIISALPKRLVEISRQLADRSFNSLEETPSEGLVRWTRTSWYRRAGLCVLPNVLVYNANDLKMEGEERITLNVHLSSVYLDGRLKEQVGSWHGPVSVSIVVEQPVLELPCIAAMIGEMVRSQPAITDYLSVHVLFRPNADLDCAPPVASSFDDCTWNRSQALEKYDNQKISTYPVNVARNVAKAHSRTSLFLSADYEHLFSKDFERVMRRLAANIVLKEDRQVLVYRIFEVAENDTKLEMTRRELAPLLANDRAVEFHVRYVGGVHSIPKLDEWLKWDGDEPAIQLSKIRYLRPSWEPRLVARVDIPDHDELFPYPSRDNTCLGWELCRVGYGFSVVHDVFVYHAGIKQGADASVRRVQAARVLSSGKYDRAVSAFMARMNALYPNTSDNCPMTP